VAWLDNDRVIFTRLKKGEPFLQMKAAKPFVFNGETVIWDTKKNKLMPFHDGLLTCSYQGYSSIAYIKPPTKYLNYAIISAWKKEMQEH
jgi:hypothetical protein